MKPSEAEYICFWFYSSNHQHCIKVFMCWMQDLHWTRVMSTKYMCLCCLCLCLSYEKSYLSMLLKSCNFSKLMLKRSCAIKWIFAQRNYVWNFSIIFSKLSIFVHFFCTVLHHWHNKWSTYWPVSNQLDVLWGACNPECRVELVAEQVVCSSFALWS